MKRPATPLPWFVRVNTDGQAIVRTEYDREGNRFPLGAPYDDKNGLANVEYAVHAANAYPKLVEAMRVARDDMREVWQKSNALRDSVAAGNMMRRFDEALRDLGEME
jgi:hypothetical protein